MMTYFTLDENISSNVPNLSLNVSLASFIIHGVDGVVLLNVSNVIILIHIHFFG